MRRALSVLALAGLVSLAAGGSARTTGAPERARFLVVDVWIDSGVPVAAWQVEVRTTAGESTMVGVEGGDGPFAEPAYYDPRALAGGRIVLAAFTTASPLPAGRHRVARLHVREGAGPAEHAAQLVVAAGAEGETVDATVTLGDAQ
jgi:hypothetical protein